MYDVPFGMATPLSHTGEADVLAYRKQSSSPYPFHFSVQHDFVQR